MPIAISLMGSTSWIICKAGTNISLFLNSNASMRDILVSHVYISNIPKIEDMGLDSLRLVERDISPKCRMFDVCEW
jgi:hypothetical protein